MTDRELEVERGRRIIVGLDGYDDWDDLVRDLRMLHEGPIGPFLRYVKLNDALDNFGGVLAFKNLWREAGISNDVGAMADMKLVTDSEVAQPQLGIMPDLKLDDVVKTNLSRIKPYAQFQPTAIVTVHMNCSVKTWQQVPKNFPSLQTALMGIPTDISEAECIARFGGTPWEKTDEQLEYICKPWNDADGNPQPPRAPQPPCVIAGKDVIAPVLAKYPGIKTVTPGIRDDWMKDKGSQERTTGIYEALTLGAWCVVMATQLITGYVCEDNPSLNISPALSQEWTAKEIERWLRDTAA